MSFWQRLPRPIIGLSPMDGVTDAAFRLIVARQGAPDVTFTEFTSVGDICRGPAFLLSPLLYDEEERPVVAQLYGKDPDLFYQAAHVVCELGFDGLDVNMGCPSRSVASSGSGAGLIRTPALAQAILRATRRGIEDWAGGQSLEAAGLKPGRAEAVRSMNRQRDGRAPSPRRAIPLSVKTRIGYDEVIVEDWIIRLLEEEPAAISVHGRTLQQMYRGEADWGAIARAAALARGTRTLLLGNGDLQSMADVVRRVVETGVDGVLVGRGALGSPWLFRNKEAVRSILAGGDVMAAGRTDSLEPAVELAERFRVMLDHARQFEALFGRERFPHLRKHLGWYCKGFHLAALMRARMVRACSSADVERLVAEYLTGTLESVTENDERETMNVCGLGTRN
ncbi:MAG: tRNA-dihydrouridine synthase [Nitrospirota bacterium]